MTTPTVRAIIPSYSYANAGAAIAFLCAAFGYEKHVVHRGADRVVAHAEWPSRMSNRLRRRVPGAK